MSLQINYDNIRVRGCIYGGWCAHPEYWCGVDFCGEDYPSDPDACGYQFEGKEVAEAVCRYLTAFTLEEPCRVEDRRVYVKTMVDVVMRHIKWLRECQISQYKDWRYILAWRNNREAGIPIPDELCPF